MSSDADIFLRFELEGGSHVDVTLAWLRQQLEPQGLHIVHAPAYQVLKTLRNVPEGELRRDQRREGWRCDVASAELTARLDHFARTRRQG